MLVTARYRKRHWMIWLLKHYMIMIIFKNMYVFYILQAGWICQYGIYISSGNFVVTYENALWYVPFTMRYTFCYIIQICNRELGDLCRQLICKDRMSSGLLTNHTDRSWWMHGYNLGISIMPLPGSGSQGCRWTCEFTPGRIIDGRARSEREKTLQNYVKSSCIR